MAGLLDLLMSSLSAPATSQGGKMGVSGSGAPTSAPSQTDSQGNVVVTAPPPGALPMGGLPAALTAQRQEASAPQGNAIPPLTSDQGPPVTPASDQSSQPVMTNYNNLGDVQAAQKAVGQYNGVNLEANDPGKGLYGLLPQNLQHGAMRNVLGALGDAFLLHAGATREYLPRIQNEQMGAAMAGVDMNDPQSVQAAATRMAATGVPGASDSANKLIEQGEQAQLRKTQMDYNNIQRQQLNQYRDTGRLQQMIPTIGGMLKSVTDPASWAQAYDQIARRTSAIGNYKPEDLGLPGRDSYDPQTLQGFGVTSNQQQVASDKAAGRGVNVSNNIRNNATKIQGDTILANGRTVDSNISAAKPSDAGILQNLIDKQNNGETLSPAETTAWHKFTDPPKGRRPSPGANSGPSVPGPSGPVNLPKDQQGNYVAGPHPMTDQQAAALPSGHNIHFLSAVDGKWHYRP